MSFPSSLGNADGTQPSRYGCTVIGAKGDTKIKFHHGQDLARRRHCHYIAILNRVHTESLWRHCRHGTAQAVVVLLRPSRQSQYQISRPSKPGGQRIRVRIGRVHARSQGFAVKRGRSIVLVLVVLLWKNAPGQAFGPREQSVLPNGAHAPGRGKVPTPIQGRGFAGRSKGGLGLKQAVRQCHHGFHGQRRMKAANGGTTSSCL